MATESPLVGHKALCPSEQLSKDALSVALFFLHYACTMHGLATHNTRQTALAHLYSRTSSGILRRSKTEIKRGRVKHAFAEASFGLLEGLKADYLKCRSADCPASHRNSAFARSKSVQMKACDNNDMFDFTAQPAQATTAAGAVSLLPSRPGRRQTAGGGFIIILNEQQAGHAQRHLRQTLDECLVTRCRKEHFSH